MNTYYSRSKYVPLDMIDAYPVCTAEVLDDDDDDDDDANVVEELDDE